MGSTGGPCLARSGGSGDGERKEQRRTTTAARPGALALVRLGPGRCVRCLPELAGRTWRRREGTTLCEEGELEGAKGACELIWVGTRWRSRRKDGQASSACRACPWFGRRARATTQLGRHRQHGPSDRRPLSRSSSALSSSDYPIVSRQLSFPRSSQHQPRPEAGDTRQRDLDPASPPASLSPRRPPSPPSEHAWPSRIRSPGHGPASGSRSGAGERWWRRPLDSV